MGAMSDDVQSPAAELYSFTAIMCKNADRFLGQGNIMTWAVAMNVLSNCGHVIEAALGSNVTWPCAAVCGLSLLLHLVCCFTQRVESRVG